VRAVANLRRSRARVRFKRVRPSGDLAKGRHRREVEVAYHQWYFGRVVAFAQLDNALVARAEEEALRLGLSALDALHVAAAVSLGADELVTTERPTTPIQRAAGVAVVGL